MGDNASNLNDAQDNTTVISTNQTQDDRVMLYQEVTDNQIPILVLNDQFFLKTMQYVHPDHALGGALLFHPTLLVLAPHKPCNVFIGGVIYLFYRFYHSLSVVLNLPMIYFIPVLIRLQNDIAGS